MWLPRAGVGGWSDDSQWEGFFLGRWKCSTIRLWGWLHNSATIPKTVELYFRVDFLKSQQVNIGALQYIAESEWPWPGCTQAATGCPGNRAERGGWTWGGPAEKSVWTQPLCGFRSQGIRGYFLRKGKVKPIKGKPQGLLGNLGSWVNPRQQSLWLSLDLENGYHAGNVKSLGHLSVAWMGFEALPSWEEGESSQLWGGAIAGDECGLAACLWWEMDVEVETALHFALGKGMCEQPWDHHVWLFPV